LDIASDDAPRLAQNLVHNGFKTTARLHSAPDESLVRAGFTEGDVLAFK
jgi:hypothetical protein